MSNTLIDTTQLLERVIQDFQADNGDDGLGVATLISDDAALCHTAEAAGGCVISPLQAASALKRNPRMPVAIVDAMADFSAPQQGVTLISQLRDIYAAQVLVIGAAEASNLNRAMLTSLGFHRWQASTDATGKRTWFIFDLAHYKVTPDWLNPKNWANPELWDKYRW